MESQKRDRDSADVVAVAVSEEAVTKKVRTHKKRRMCVIYGYRGKGYHGSARGGGTAANQVPTIEAEVEKALKLAGAIDAASDLGNISFTRASRTDKGVSAMGNVFGANLLFSKEELDNRSLWINHVNSFLPESIRIWAAFKVRGSFSAKDAPCSRTYDYVAPSFCFLPPSHDPNLQVIDDAGVAHLNSVLLYFLGTNNFHNYTNGKTVESKEAKRIILSFKVIARPIIGGKEFLHFRIKGQSFMLHQIRKMICMVMQIARSGVSIEQARMIIIGSFGRPHINVMKAPSVGLLLREVHFDQYNKLWGKGEGRERVELSPEIVARVDAFAQAQFWPDVAEEAQEFTNFLADLAEFPLNLNEVAATGEQMEKNKRPVSSTKSVQNFD